MGSRRWEAVRADGQAAPGGAGRSAAQSPPATGGYSNRMVQRYVQRVRAADDGHERQADEVARSVARGEVASPLPVDPVRGGEALNPALRRAVQTARGGGHRVPDRVRQPMEQALATDFGQVRIHTGRLADGLNRTLSARAFTTGRDIFVRGDEYDPSSQSGRELLAHELTHVAQQGGAPPGALVQRAPSRKKGAKTYTDPNIPGATLTFICPKRGGGEAYKVEETGDTFVYYEDSDTYEVDGVPVKPTQLIPDEESYESSSETSEEAPKKPKKKAPPPKKKKRKHESSEESSEEIVPKKKKKEVPKKRAKKDKDKATRRSDTHDPLFSDYSSSDDDSAELTYEEQFGILEEYGAYKFKALTELNLPKAGDVFLWNDPHARKSFAAHRTKKGDKFVDIDRIHTGRIGHQSIAMLAKKGHFIGAGGNPDRPDKMSEPPADYASSFKDMKALGGDKNARALLTAAGDTSKIEGGRLSDRQLAAIILHAMNNPFGTSLRRTQLTENLGKLLAIFMSETARSFEATKGRYDVSVLIKASLQNVIDGKGTLYDAFYSGKGGEDSIFLGAPSKERSPSGIGGAAQLRDPYGHTKALRRQMSVFPTKKRDLKAFVNRSKTGTVATLSKVSKPDRQRAKKAEAASQVKAAGLVLEQAKDLEVPTEASQVLDWSGTYGPWKKAMNKANFELKKSTGNKAAIALITQAITILNTKKRKATALVGV